MGEPRAVDSGDDAEHDQDAEGCVHRSTRHPRLLGSVEDPFPIGEGGREGEHRPDLHAVEQQEQRHADDVQEHPEVSHGRQGKG